MYVVLIGPSGQTRKGEALNIGREFIDTLGIPTISQSIIREALVRALADNLSSFPDPDTGLMEWHCSATCISDELSVFLGQKHIKFLADLTDWYDSRDVWTYETKHQGTDRLMGVCLNLLGATAPDWLPSILPQEAVGGGWTSRTIFVVEEYKGKVVADPNIIGIDEKLKENLAADLEQIHLLTGQIVFSDKALACYIEWYKRQEAGIKKGIFPVPDPRFAGYTARRATHIKKVCMTVSASRGDDMIITISDFNRSLKILEMTEAKQSFTFDGLDTRPVASVLRRFSAPVVLAHDLSKQERLLLLAHDSDPFNRWEAGRTLARQSLLATINEGSAPDAEWLGALQAVLSDEALELAYRALMLGLPSHADLANTLYDTGNTPDPAAIHAAVETSRDAMAQAFASTLS
ncbi:hypothetical protein LCGC14_2817420, partial [marine sediment metagenome]